MSHQIRKVGVIGAGVMGATIAAHMANVGLDTVLLDIVPPQMPDALAKKGVSQDSKQFRNYLADKGLADALKAKPAAFYIPEDAKRVATGNLEDDLQMLGECDWVIEVVVERLDIKKDLLSRLEAVVKDDALVTTNTSGISVASMSGHLSQGFQERFFGTHFFNPPRYMKLFEIIPGPQTKPEHIEAMAEFAEKRLGKGIVFAKDTPNFIGNRIGVFSGNLTNKLMVDYDFTIEQVDALTGPVIGRPKMATYRLGDLVGLDVMAHVASNVREAATDDERLEIFEPFPWVEEMIKKGWLGNKTGQGFYKKVKGEGGKKEIQVLDWKKLEYRPKQKAKFASLEAANQQSGTKDKLKSIYYATDEGGKFVFQLLSEIFIYSANRIPEISDDIVNIDNAMKWGYNWKLGPFESWDAVGVEKSAAKMKEAGYEIPAWVDKMLAAGAKSFYKMEAGVNYYWDVAAEAYQEVPISPQIILLPSLKDRDQVVASNQGASIVDLGDGVICVEFHTKMNALGPDIANMLHKACDLVEEGQFEGIVLANHGSNFSVGANLMLVLFTAQEEEWDELLFMVKGLQDTYMRLKYLSRPVVAAPHQMALGGGCEACLHADRVVAAAETYIGLVEVGVGVVPAGGGTKELLIRNTEERLFRVQKGGIYPKDVYLLPFVARAFETIAQAKVATSAKEAKKMGFLRDADKISLNSDYRIKMAKDNVLAMNLAGYEAPEPLRKIRVMGREAMGTIDYVLYNMHKAGWITPHDITVARKVGWVLTGGEVLPDTEVSEQYLLELEREAFVSLCGTKETQARMAHMLKTGKPLRN